MHVHAICDLMVNCIYGMLCCTGYLQESYKQAPPAGPDEHQLQYCYSFRFSQRPQGGARQAAEKYEQNVKLVGCFSTVEQFWSYYCYMKRPGDLPSPCDIHLFKVGIAPIWEVSKVSARAVTVPP